MICDIEESVNFLDQTFVNPAVGFPCRIFNFVRKSESGLKSHNTKKHSVLNSENESSKIETEKIYDDSYNIECFWCTFRARSMEEMRKHKVENYIYEFHN